MEHRITIRKETAQPHYCIFFVWLCSCGWNDQAYTKEEALVQIESHKIGVILAKLELEFYVEEE